MMKTRFYITALSLVMALGSCQKLDQKADPQSVSGTDKLFSYSLSDYMTLSTRSAENAVDDIVLLQFDANGQFVGRSEASDLQTGTFRAKVSGHTRIVHFIANYDWSAFDERAWLGKHENTLIPSLESDGWVLWDRLQIDDFDHPPAVKLLRNLSLIHI